MRQKSKRNLFLETTFIKHWKSLFSVAGHHCGERQNQKSASSQSLKRRFTTTCPAPCDQNLMPNYIQILVISPWTSCLENRDKTTKTNVWFYGAWWLIRESVLQQLCSAIPCKILKVGQMDLEIGVRGYRRRIEELLIPVFTILGFLFLPFSFLVLHFLLLFPIPSLSPFHNLQIYSINRENLKMHTMKM